MAPSAGAQALDPALANTMWHVTEIKGEPASNAETVEFTDSKIVGKSACNYISGSVRQTGGTLEIDKLAVTIMGCAKSKAAAERRYFSAVRAVRRHAATEKELLLLRADGSVLLRLTTK